MYTMSARWQEVILDSHSPIARVRAMPSIQFGPAPDGGLELEIVAGNVRLSSTADIRGTLDLTVPGHFWDSLEPRGVELFVERGIDYGDGTQEYCPCGYYRVQRIKQEDAPDGPIKVSASDRGVRLREHRVVFPFSYPVGTTHTELFEKLINGHTLGPGPLDRVTYPLYNGKTVPITFLGYDGDNALLPAGVVEDFVYDHLSKIVDSRNCAIQFDRTGGCVVTLRDRPPSDPSVYTIAPGGHGNLIKVGRELTREATYNIVVARGSDPAYPTGFGETYIDDPNSPLTYQGPFEAVIRKYASPFIHTLDQAAGASIRLVNRYKGLPSGLSVITLPDPSIDPLDPITLAPAGIPTTDALSDEVLIPLDVETAVTVTTRARNEVTDEPDYVSGDGGAGSPGGPPVFPAAFRDSRAYPAITGDGAATVVNVSTSAQLTAALAAAVAGQVIRLANGTYSGVFTVNAKGTQSKPIVIRAAIQSGPVFATGSKFIADSAEWVLIKGLAFPYDQEGDTLTVKGASRFVRVTRCLIGPVTPNAEVTTASVPQGHYIHVTGQAQDCVVDYNELRNKARPGNGIVVDGDTSVSTYTGGCKHILVAHNDIHDFGTEVANGFEAIRCGASTVSRTESCSAIIRNVLLNIRCEPEVISVKMAKVDVWGNALKLCVGSICYRHGTDGYVGHNYIRGALPANTPIVGSAGTKTGGIRGYDTGHDWSENYLDDINGDSYEAALVIDGGETAPAINGHWPLKNIKVRKNLLVGCQTGILMAPHYTVPPDSVIVTDNVVVAPKGQTTAIKTTKAPTGTNVLAPNTYFADIASAGLTIDVDDVYRKDGVGPRLTYLHRSDVGITGDLAETDGTGRSIGGASGGTPTGGGTPGGGGTPPGTPASSIADLLKLGKADGYSKCNIGIGYTSGHKDHTLAELENGFSEPGYFELTSDKLRAKLSVPLNGGTTSSNTKYPRVEFRQLNSDGTTKTSFNPNENKTRVVGALSRVTRMPPSKPQLCLLQSHDASDDTAMIYMNSKTVVQAKLGDTVMGTLTSSFVFGTDYYMKITIVGDGSKSVVKWYWGTTPADMTTPKFTSSSATRSTTWYLKGGNYAQSNTTYDSLSDGPFIVEMTKFVLWETGMPLPVGWI